MEFGFKAYLVLKKNLGFPNHEKPKFQFKGILLKTK